MAQIGAVHVSAEYWPYARTGGLAEAVRGLAEFQAGTGMPITVVVPLYGTVRAAGADLLPLGEPFVVRVGAREEEGRLFQLAGTGSGPRVLFVEQAGYFDRPGIYGEEGQDYGDNLQRFAFFSRAVLQLLPRLTKGPVVVHAHDWHTALVPVCLRTELVGQPFYDGLGTVLSVHNAGFQGHFAPGTVTEVGLPAELYDSRWLEWYGRANWLKGGIVFADLVTTVSPTHARELCTDVGGFGLHDVFTGLGDRFLGILNGIDRDAWNPATDPEITGRYSGGDLSGKRRCKAAVQRTYRLPQRARVPLFALSARLVAQKGIDLILADHEFFTHDAQLVVLGDGEPGYRDALTGLAASFPERMATQFEFTDRLEHRLLAGADFLLMPSLYEPCGLTQMRAMRYGTLPVARRVGGLADTIRDGVTGFLFDAYTPQALEEALHRALARYADPHGWQSYVREAMRCDFGWERSADQYLKVYRRALARGAGA